MTGHKEFNRFNSNNTNTDLHTNSVVHATLSYQWPAEWLSASRTRIQSIHDTTIIKFNTQNSVRETVAPLSWHWREHPIYHSKILDKCKILCFWKALNGWSCLASREFATQTIVYMKCVGPQVGPNTMQLTGSSGTLAAWRPAGGWSCRGSCNLLICICKCNRYRSNGS